MQKQKLSAQLLKLSLAPALACLSLLSGCASKVTTKAEYVYPPQAYTTPCQKSPFTVTTYGDAVLQLVKVAAERDKCASQVDNLNKWIAQNKAAK
ncbi:Rz1-like lysis system protein LysC [Aggregatibacter kilianii]|uniref:Rz1-like lysis system protein LysC n=1 Tax=Aggregatibacter kilianii TaxID=2025884 RepID=UPI0028D424B5|nr:Rz1-like lysis system protein LysC [Aggregatibacter kilianii]